METPLFIELHYLPLATRINFKSLMLAFKVLNGTAATYLNALAKAYVTTRSLWSSKDAAYQCLHHAQDNPDSFHVSFHNGGMTYQALPEVGHSYLSSRNF